MSSSRKQRIRQVVELAEKAGWRVEHRRANHLQFKSPDGVTTIVTGTTPGDPRGLLNLRAAFNRAGLKLPR